MRKFKHKQTGIIGTLQKDQHVHFERCSGNVCANESLYKTFVINCSDWEEIKNHNNINFRVFFYDGIDKETGTYISFGEAVVEDYIRAEEEGLEPIDQCILIEQYVGIEDMEGESIYVGDYLEDSQSKRRYVVIAVPGGFGVNSFQDDLHKEEIVWWDGLSDMQNRSWVMNSCKVVGNVNEGLYEIGN